jgi:hypothetical protein
MSLQSQARNVVATALLFARLVPAAGADADRASNAPSANPPLPAPGASHPTASAAASARKDLAATVDGKPILISEVREAMRDTEELFRWKYLPGQPQEYRRRIEQLWKETLEQRIDRVLMLAEYERMWGNFESAALERDARALVQQRINTRFGGDQDRFAEYLEKSGISADLYRLRCKQDLVIDSMKLAQARRIPPPTPEDIEKYYREHGSRFLVIRPGRAPAVKPLEDVKEEIRRTLLRERSTAALQAWLDALRITAIIRRFPAPPDALRFEPDRPAGR